jgi:hypothetical protein
MISVQREYKQCSSKSKICHEKNVELNDGNYVVSVLGEQRTRGE